MSRTYKYPFLKMENIYSDLYINNFTREQPKNREVVSWLKVSFQPLIQPQLIQLITKKLFYSQSYLADKALVHRDLAARNVLVGHGKLLKIADFGLMRQAYHEVYEVKTQRRLPLKWMAPESIYEEIFSSKSDV